MGNLIPEVAKMIGVEIGEEFKLDGGKNTFKLQENGLFDNYNVSCPYLLWSLLTENVAIIKLPLKPKMGIAFWSYYVNRNGAIFTKKYIYDGCVDERVLIRSGFVYRTENEANAHMVEFAEWLGGEEKNNE